MFNNIEIGYTASKAGVLSLCNVAAGNDFFFTTGEFFFFFFFFFATVRFDSICLCSTTKDAIDVIIQFSDCSKKKVPSTRSIEFKSVE